MLRGIWLSLVCRTYCNFWYVSNDCLDAFLKAGKVLVIMGKDYNGAFKISLEIIHVNLRNGVCSSKGLEYLGKKPRWFSKQFVRKVKVNQNIARGIYSIKNLRKQDVKAKKEVILSAEALKVATIVNVIWNQSKETFTTFWYTTDQGPNYYLTM